MKKTLLFLYILCFIPSTLIADVVSDTPEFKKARDKLVKYYIKGHGISDPKVIAALRDV